MGLLFWSIVGGLVGTGLMDIADGFAERLKLTRGGVEGEIGPSVGGP